MSWQNNGGDHARHPNPSMSQLGKEISHLDRVQILLILATQPSCVSTLADAIELDGYDISRHLKRLRRRRLVAFDPNGKKHIYHLANGVQVTADDRMVTVIITTSDGVQISLRGRKPPGAHKTNCTGIGPVVSPTDQSRLA